MFGSRKFSLDSRGLKYKLKIAFCLMTVLPLLVCTYLISTYILPQAGVKTDILLSMAISIFIAAIGFYVVHEIVQRIVAVATEVKRIAAGDLSRQISVGKRDEIDDLGQALNHLTQRIRLNIDELNSYKEVTSQIDQDIQKRLLVLSTLLQVNNLVSQGKQLDEILKFSIDKIRALTSSQVAYLFFKKVAVAPFELLAAEGVSAEGLRGLSFGDDDPLFARAISSGSQVVFDAGQPAAPEVKKIIRSRFGAENILASPVFLQNRVTAIVGIARDQANFLYQKDERELLDIFAKQLAIAVENDNLARKVRDLEIRDPLTGLYNETFITARLEEEIKRAKAYQRPCSFILLNVDNFQKLKEVFGIPYGENVLKKTGEVVLRNVNEVDRVARLSENEFAVVLPERNKRQAQTIAEEIRVKVEALFKNEKDALQRVTVSGGVSENPLDGVDAQELIAKARSLVALAKSHGRNRVLH